MINSGEMRKTLLHTIIVYLFASVHSFDSKCAPHTSCNQNGEMDFQSRGCECDPLCSTYGDCCIDAIRPAEPGLLRPTSYSCVTYGSTHQAAYVITSCPDYKPSDLKKRCLQSDDLLPVTDRTSNTTYRNHFCADCYGIPSTSLVSWIQICYHAQNDINHALNTFNHTQKDSNHALLHPVTPSRSYISCTLTMPESVNVRMCMPGLISTCVSNWTDLETKRRCQSEPMGVVYSAGGHAYRNAFCAICNGLEKEKLLCEKIGSVRVVSRKRRRMSFATLMDFYDKSGSEEVGYSNNGASKSESFITLQNLLKVFAFCILFYM